MSEVLASLLEALKWVTSTPEGLPYLIIGVLTAAVWRLNRDGLRDRKLCEHELFIVTRAFVKLLSSAQKNAGDKRVIFSADIKAIETEMLDSLGRTREELL